MAAVRQAGTSVEIAVKEALEDLGIEFTTNIKDKLGSPYIWLSLSDIPVFVHGCFWHRHEGCKKATTPKTNTEFWLDKLANNQRRDVKVQGELEALGYEPITVWQCETTSRATLSNVLTSRIGTKQT